MKKYILFIALFIISCGDKSQQGDMGSQGGTSGGSRGMAWTAPTGWITEAPGSSMRVAQFRLPKAESDPEDGSVVVFYFQGQGGGVEDNIQRWITQFKDGKANDRENFEANGLKHTMVDIEGTFLFQPRPMAPTTVEKPGFRMLGDVIETSSGPWFVKFIGPEKTVAKWQDSFKEFLSSIKQG